MGQGVVEGGCYSERVESAQTQQVFNNQDLRMVQLATAIITGVALCLITTKSPKAFTVVFITGGFFTVFPRATVKTYRLGTGHFVGVDYRDYATSAYAAAGAATATAAAAVAAATNTSERSAFGVGQEDDPNEFGVYETLRRQRTRDEAIAAGCLEIQDRMRATQKRVREERIPSGRDELRTSTANADPYAANGDQGWGDASTWQELSANQTHQVGEQRPSAQASRLRTGRDTIRPN